MILFILVCSSTRVYWSTKHVNHRCVYTCRIIAVKPQCQKESTNPASDEQLAIEHNTTKIEDPVLANATMATHSLTSTGATKTADLKLNDVLSDPDQLESTKTISKESQSELADDDCSKNCTAASSNLLGQMPEGGKANNQCQQKNPAEEIEETQLLAGSEEPSAKANDSSQNMECLGEENEVATLDIAQPLSPSTQTALETLQDTSNLVFAGEDEKKWLESLPEDMEAIVVVAQGEDITTEEAIQLATEALQVAGNEDKQHESDPVMISGGVEEVETPEAKLEPDSVEEVTSTEECCHAVDVVHCNRMITMGKKTLPDNFHETSLYDVTEAQVLTEGNKEVMYLGVEHKPVEVISLNRRTLSMNLKNKSKCSRLTSRSRESKSNRFSPIYGADGKIIGHKLSISDALSLKSSPPSVKNTYHGNVENKRAKKLCSKNSPMRLQTPLKKQDSSSGNSISIDDDVDDKLLAHIENKKQTSSAIVTNQLNDLKCKMMNGENCGEVIDSSHVDCCNFPNEEEESHRTEIKQENNAEAAWLGDKTWSDNSLEMVKNQERNKNSPPVKVYPLRQTVSRMCEQALAKRPLEAISRSCRDDRTKSLLASQSLIDPQTLTTTCGDSVSIKKNVEDAIPLHDKIALKIKAESLAKSSPGERGPFKCPTCKRLYRTKESFETHVEKCDFELSTSEEDDDEQDSLRSPRRYLGNPRYPMRSTTLIQRVAAEVEAEMNLIKKFCPRKRSHDSVSTSDITGMDSLDPIKSRNKQIRRDAPVSTDPVEDMTTGCDNPNQLHQPEQLLGCDNDTSNKSVSRDSSCCVEEAMLSSDIPKAEKVCQLQSEPNNNCSSDTIEPEVKTSNNDDVDFDSDATLSPLPYDNFLDKNFQSDEESNNSMLCPKTGFTIPAGTNRNNLDLLSELATKLSKPDTSKSEKAGHLLGLKSAEPKLPSDIALAKKMSVVEVPGGLYKQKFEVINGKIGKVCSAKSSSVGDLAILPNHADKSSEPLVNQRNSLEKPNVLVSKDTDASKLSEGASTHGSSESQNKSGHQSLFERIFHSIDATSNVSKSLLNVLENPLTTTSNTATVSPSLHRGVVSESNFKLNSGPKDSIINVGCESSQKCLKKINNCLLPKPVSGVNKDLKLPAMQTSSVSQSSSSSSSSPQSTTSSLLAVNSHHTCETSSNNQAVPVKSVEAKPSQPPLFVRPSTMASQVLTTPVVTMALCNTVCSLTSQTTCMVAPAQQLGVPMQSASPHVLGLTTANGPIFQSPVLSTPALPPLAAPTAFAPAAAAAAAVTPITLAQSSKSQPSQPQPTLNINYVGSFVLPTPTDQLVTISRSIASIPLSSIATSVPHLQAASSLGSVVTSAKLQSPTVAVPPQQNSVLLPDGSIQTIHKTPVPTMQTPNSIVKILVDNSSTQFVASANTSPQPQGSIYNYGKLLQEIFKAPALTNQTANPAVFTTSSVSSNQLANETQILNPVKCITTANSSHPEGLSVVNKCDMHKMIYTPEAKPNVKVPGILRQQNPEERKSFIDSCDTSQILSGVQKGSKFIMDFGSKQDHQMTNVKSYMPPVKKTRPNLLRKQQSDVGVQSTKQIVSYLANKNGLTDYQKNSCPLEVSPQKLINSLEVNQKFNNQNVLINTTNQLSETSQETKGQIIPNSKNVCKPPTPRSRRKSKPIVRHRRLDLKGRFVLVLF